jgi:hypothetical protein
MSKKNVRYLFSLSSVLSSMADISGKSDDATGLPDTISIGSPGWIFA